MTNHKQTQKLEPSKSKPLTCPLHFEPYLRPTVWGGRRLGDLLGKALPGPEPYGEAWEVSDHPQHRSLCVAGDSGQTLRRLMEEHGGDLLGQAAARYSVFPWLIKHLDCHDWLSVQVHPNEDKVKDLWPGEGSKTEVWFVLDVLPGGLIYAGLKPGVDEKVMRKALAQGNVADCLHRFTPMPGDCLFLPAGSVHAVGGGVLMAEVQQTSDATFRLFDWNRRDAQGKSRQLHVEESLACIDWSQGPLTPVHAPNYHDPLRTMPRQTLCRSAYFELAYSCDLAPFALGGSGQLQALAILSGRGHLTGPVRAGQVWILPAAMGPVTCDPEGGMQYLLCTLPTHC